MGRDTSWWRRLCSRRAWRQPQQKLATARPRHPEPLLASYGLLLLPLLLRPLLLLPLKLSPPCPSHGVTFRAAAAHLLAVLAPAGPSEQVDRLSSPVAESLVALMSSWKNLASPHAQAMCAALARIVRARGNVSVGVGDIAAAAAAGCAGGRDG